MKNPNNAIGLVELSCIHKGIEVHDRMLKSAEVETLLARSLCPGKYLVLVRGELAQVEASAEAARETAQYGLINAMVIPNIDERVFPAITGVTPLNEAALDGVLVFETFSVASCIKAADFAIKAADVNILRIHVAMAAGGKGFFVLTGDIEALKAAQEPALDFLKQEGSLVGYSLITQPCKEILASFV